MKRGIIRSSAKRTVNQGVVYDLDNGQWNIPQLRTLLSQVLGNSQPVEGFKVEHAFPALGRRNMLLNARRFAPGGDYAESILLAIEDIT